MKDITYRVEGDYLIPNIILDDEADDSPEEMIGIYGMMRESFLREHRHGTYTAMLLMGKLTSHLREVDRQADEEVEYLLRQMMERQGVDEALKASDQMAWVQKVNVLRVMAEEYYQKEDIGWLGQRKERKGIKVIGMEEKTIRDEKGERKIGTISALRRI